MLPDRVKDALQPHLGRPIRNHASVSGGCIANAGRLETGDRVLFLKWSDDEAAQTFPAEAAGLKALRTADSPLRVPNVIAVQGGSDDAPGVLLMEWIEPGRAPDGFWDDFGRGLAALHRHTADRYGFERDNFIGRLPQQNDWEGRWPDFFRTRRLAPQVEGARERGRWQASWDAALEALYRRLDELLPATPEASVVHGDLWGGNFMKTAAGPPALVDPATYYGHREADLAMTQLFGGFNARFYDAYQEAWPLEAGYEERKEVYNLYHLINHLNHFGAGYASGVQRILRRLA